MNRYNLNKECWSLLIDSVLMNKVSDNDHTFVFVLIALVIGLNLLLFKIIMGSVAPAQNIVSFLLQLINS